LTYKIARRVLIKLVDHETKEKSTYKEDSQFLWLTNENVQSGAYAVLLW
jgi:hypothetical protein